MVPSCRDETAWADQENYILAALFKLASTLAKSSSLLTGWLVDLQNYVATAQIDVVGERSRLHVPYNHAFCCRHVELLGDIRRQLLYGDAELVLFGRTLVVLTFVVAQAGGEQFGTVCNRGRSYPAACRCVRNRVPPSSQACAKRYRPPARNPSYTFLAVDCGDGVSDFQT